MDKIDEINLEPDHIAKFWMQVQIDKSCVKWTHADYLGHCWIWKGSYFNSGYGRYNAKYKTFRAHRIAYYLYYGNISDDKLICHKCDNPKCVNPKHLFEGTPKDNIKDRDRKRRYIPPGKNKKNSSKYHGVFFMKEKKENVWRAKIWHKYRCYQVGYFKSEIDAAKAYDKEVKRLGFDKTLNFPDD